MIPLPQLAAGISLDRAHRALAIVEPQQIVEVVTGDVVLERRSPTLGRARILYVCGGAVDSRDDLYRGVGSLMERARLSSVWYLAQVVFTFVLVLPAERIRDCYQLNTYGYLGVPPVLWTKESTKTGELHQGSRASLGRRLTGGHLAIGGTDDFSGDLRLTNYRGGGP